MYHLGELKVQARAGVQHQAERVGKIIISTMPWAAQEFLCRQPFVVLSSVDAQGQVWVSALSGMPGFVHAPDDQTVAIDSALPDHEPLRKNLQANSKAGMLAIELASRRRMRVNGRASLRDEGVTIHAQQVYSNCPKYIQARDWEFVHEAPAPIMTQRSDVLDAGQQAWIRHADTFFIGSFHPEAGADASHRGGNPGFVKILDAKTLLWPDYIGNNMFNTLGNIAAYPNAGLLFMDFAQGTTLQLTGSAQIVWDTKRMEPFSGAQRLVEFGIAQVVEARTAHALRWRFGDYSPYNP